MFICSSLCLSFTFYLNLCRENESTNYLLFCALKFTGSRNKNDKCMFLLYIEANSVSNSKGQKTKASQDGCKHATMMEFSLKDLYAIQEIQAEEHLFKLIVKYV